MSPYQTKIKKLSGTSYSEVRNEALVLFNKIKKRTKRRPYIRSVYFNKQKIFFDYFWQHLFQKNPKERFRRLKYFGAALEVLRYSRSHPHSCENPHKKNEILHRFAALLGLLLKKIYFIFKLRKIKRAIKNILCLVFRKNSLKGAG